MAIKTDREYRDFKNFSLIETRAEEDGDGSKIVEGYASTFDVYDLYEFKFDGVREVYREQIARDAFTDTDMSDVVFLRDHEGQVFARTKNGLIALTVDDNGLFTRTDLSKTAGALEMFEDIKAKNYTQMSFAFTSDRDKETWTEERDGDVVVYTRTIGRIKKIYDISAVGFPANPNTDISPATRSIFDGEIEKLRAERREAEQRARARAALALKIKLSRRDET